MLPCHAETQNVSAVLQKHILLLESKIDAGSNVSHVAKTGKHWENVRATGVSGNTFPRFARPLVTY